MPADCRTDFNINRKPYMVRKIGPTYHESQARAVVPALFGDFGQHPLGLRFCTGVLENAMLFAGGDQKAFIFVQGLIDTGDGILNYFMFAFT